MAFLGVYVPFTCPVDFFWPIFRVNRPVLHSFQLNKKQASSMFLEFPLVNSQIPKHVFLDPLINLAFIYYLLICFWKKQFCRILKGSNCCEYAMRHYQAEVACHDMVLWSRILSGCQCPCNYFWIPVETAIDAQIHARPWSIARGFLGIVKVVQWHFLSNIVCAFLLKPE